ncbi:MAG: vWA domain-containing protein [Methanoregula sp.]
MASADLTLTGSSDKVWLIANGADTAKITVTVVNTTTGIPASGAIVTFTVYDPTYGSFPTTSATADAAGVAVGTFKVKTKSGTATILANAKYTDTSTTPSTISVSTNPLQIDQKIDHDSLYKAEFLYPFNGTVKSTVQLDAILWDRWNNPIDDRNPSEIHNVTLHVHGPGIDDVGFEDGGLVLHDITKTLDTNGHTLLMVNLTSKPGYNTIMMDRAASMVDQYRTIEAVANGIPYSITASYSPLTGGQPRMEASSDPTKFFTIYYTLFDYYGNPTQDQSIWINTTFSDGTADLQSLRSSGFNGQVWTEYGPKNIAGEYTITATSVNQDTVTTSQILYFVNSAPTNLELSASPQTVPSRDASPSIVSVLSAKVVDDFGNPVGNQLVSFDISPPQYDCAGDACVAGGPSFSTSGTVLSTSAITSAVEPDFGVAKVNVYPGSFKVAGVSGYEPTATGNATITATWDTVHRDTLLVWKNYPYLSAVTKITPAQVKVGDTVDINLKLNGDGWKLSANPVDVSLAVDTSGSMKGEKLDAAKAAATNFVNSMVSVDRVGLVSYGETATLQQFVDLDHSKTTSFLLPSPSGLSANGYTPTRQALYYSITDLIDHPNANPKAVQAVILMTDGEFNYYGDPLGRGTGYSSYYAWTGTNINKYTILSAATQDMSALASSKDIRIYTISFTPTKDDTTDTWKTMDTLSSTTNGKHYWAGDAAMLNSIYQEIAGELREEAGVDTTAELNFGSVLVNNVLTPDAFEYVGDPFLATGTPAKAPGSTMMDKYNKTINPLTGKVFHLIPGPEFSVIGPVYKNQTTDWNADKKLSFDIGTIRLGETWETNMRFRVLKEGSYTLFGPGSCINFKDSLGNAAEPLCLGNEGSFTASNDPVPNPLSYQTIDLSIPQRTDEPGATEILTRFPVKFYSTYSGAPGKEVTVDISYVHDHDPAVLIRTEKYIQGSPSPYIETLYADFSLASKPVGGYHYHIHAYTDDANGYQESGECTYTTSDKNFIKLE